MFIAHCSLFIEMSPLIGITTYERNESAEFSLGANYVDAVREAGGLPVLLTPGEANIAQLLDRLDGLVLTGGGDADPALYGGANHPKVHQVNGERDRFELELARASLDRAFPVFAVCRGMQIQAIAAGCPLVVHLPERYGTEIEHRLDLAPGHVHITRHCVTLDPESQLAAIMDTTELGVASWHHQAIAKVPPNWQLVGQSADGVIEAMEYQLRPWVIAVQWHPELTHKDPFHAKLWRSFVDAAR